MKQNTQVQVPQNMEYLLVIFHYSQQSLSKAFCWPLSVFLHLSNWVINTFDKLDFPLKTDREMGYTLYIIISLLSEF